MVTLTADLKGTIDGIHFTLELHILGGPLALQFKLDDPIPLLKVYNWGSEELHKLIGIGLPDLTGGPWSKIIDIGSPPVGLIPSVWLAPGSSTDAFHMELALNPPIKIGGTANYGGLEITVEPNFSILALYLIYNKAAGGLDFKAKVEIPNQVSKAKAALGAAGESARTQMVSYPFPVPPQSSKSSFQLHYFGLGQRIGPDPVTGVTDPIETIFAQIEDQFKTNDPAEILTGLARNFYKPDRDWFIGAHLTLRNWDLKIIFNDPAMYGVRVACPETPTTFFSGFLFEILYEKLGPNLGVYFGALTLPDTLRRINIDGVILILPGFSIWIYTNGDFRVNVGWPLGQSSIGIQLAELTGKAGFYFAKLRSSDNPGYKPGKGTDFDPIIKFGIGVGVYVSVSVNAGIFSASLDASLTATLQGLLAWKGKEVDGRSEGSSMSNPPDHYWFAGTADLLILIQGSVDFVVIKASVTIKLTASTDMALETGCKTLIYVAAGVEAEASIKIIFFTIHFHFSIQVSHTFIIGSGDKTASINGPVNMPGGTGEIQSPDVAAAQKTLRQLIDRQVAHPAIGLVVVAHGRSHDFLITSQQKPQVGQEMIGPHHEVAPFVEGRWRASRLVECFLNEAEYCLVVLA
nr:hypothetical protein [Calditrichia bacterium]